MNCFSCGAEIPDSKRMCDECAIEFVEHLAKDRKKKEQQGQPGSAWQFPKGAPTGTVKSWKPHKKEQGLIKGSLKPAPHTNLASDSTNPRGS